MKLFAPASLLLLCSLGATPAIAQSAACPAVRTTVNIHGSADSGVRTCERNRLMAALQASNVNVRLGPDVDFDFSDVTDEQLPIRVGRCVSLTSVDHFDARDVLQPCDAISTSSRSSLSSNVSNHGARERPVHRRHWPNEPSSAQLPSARNPHSPGPVLRYGANPNRKASTFLEITCTDAALNGSDGVRISGFRLFGPTFGNQKGVDTGVLVHNCVDLEISNLELAGWGNAAIQIDHSSLGQRLADRDPTQIQVRIHDNFIHNNQHPSNDGHAFGYGVELDTQAWANIYNNVFDFNRHSITAGGLAGGYRAEHNLVLKGGGFHDSAGGRYIQVFDVHGTANCPETIGTHYLFNCGDAGRSFWFLENVMQYKRTYDIKLRGKPAGLATIDGNIFARSDQSAAIDLNTDVHVKVGHSNVYDVDGFGQYRVCDFDGDGIDDLFFATGVTWWLSSSGRFPWFFMRADQMPPANLRVGYFDNDDRCDVLSERPIDSGQWFISSGGMTDWLPFASLSLDAGQNGPILSEVRFGRFNAQMRDHRPQVTRRTTDAFWRRGDGQWFVSPLSHPAWHAVASSGFPLSDLQFGDFTGDGVTDVLAVQGGHWAISDSASGGWQRLNETLGDPVGKLYIANMDADDNIDDVLRFDRKVVSNHEGTTTLFLTWWRSKNGTGPWTVWRKYTVPDAVTGSDFDPYAFGFVGRFGAVPGGATMVIDNGRTGLFFSPAEARAGSATDWTSLFQY